MYRQLNYDLHGKAAPEIVSLMIKKLGLPESRSTRGEIIRLMKYLADFESKIDISFMCPSWVAKYGYNCLEIFKPILCHGILETILTNGS